MKAKILYGILLFFVGVAMVACGDKGSSSPATPNTYLTPAIPITGGGFNPTNTQCPSQTCTYSGVIQITNPTNFALMGSISHFRNANGGNFDVNGGEIHNIGDFFKSIIGNLTFGVVLDTHGNVDWGVNTNGNLQNQQGTLDLPPVNSIVPCSMRVTANRITGSYTLPNGISQGFDAQASQNVNGSLVYIDQYNKIVFFTAPNSVGNVTSLGVGAYTDQGIGQAGMFQIQRAY